LGLGDGLRGGRRIVSVDKHVSKTDFAVLSRALSVRQAVVCDFDE
jgi:hypothetical protein